MTPGDLFRAIEERDVPAVKVAIRAGVDPDARTDDGAPALLLAAQFAGLDMVCALLSGGADVRAADDADDGRTALHYAALRGDVAMIDELFGAGALVDARDHDGGTPLHEAAAWGLTGAARALLDRGADVNAVEGPSDMSALWWAARGDHRPLVELLLGAGADPDAATAAGRTALHEASATGSDAIVAMLLAAGADPSRRDRDGETALDAARGLAGRDLEAHVRELASGKGPVEVRWIEHADGTRAIVARAGSSGWHLVDGHARIVARLSSAAGALATGSSPTGRAAP
jgi:ankyrin repeat protein